MIAAVIVVVLVIISLIEVAVKAVSGRVYAMISVVRLAVVGSNFGPSAVGIAEAAARGAA